MKKRSRRPRLTGRTASPEKKGSRGRPRKTVAVTTDGFYGDNAGKLDDGVEKHVEGKSRSSGRLSTAMCRLCHGKFSPRSLRHAFVKWPRNSPQAAPDEESPLLFHTDFQRLVGVPLDRDPRLSDFICKKCHAKFYKCHSILLRFLQRVNLPPAEALGPGTRRNVKCPESSENHGSAAPPSFTSDPKCLHSLVLWAHQHAEACRSCPDLKEVLEGQCWGAVRAVWGCVDGHTYTMDTRYAAASSVSVNFGRATVSSNGEGDLSEEEQEGEEVEEEQPSAGSPAATAQSSLMENWRAEDFSVQDEALSPSPALLEDQTADSELSDRVASEEEFEGSRRGGALQEEEEELFEPYSDRSVSNKRRSGDRTAQEPKVKKKPGPKPGWKNKFKPKGEELPNIYKCPYQGCTAVYRAPDGLKKHIKEHHEEVRERPCPHPGCNKVFMIDRYLQRHVKLIHTEERNYICDQCGQTFKQRKHLSVHQMRHSGAKPLQCEVCGFQCRQRASLKYHMTKHKAEADLEFECLMCRKRFEKAHNLNVHMSMVHPLTQTEVQRGPDQPPQPPERAAAASSDLHAVTLSGEAVQQEQDR
ncbi:zinc finger protein 276 [Salarias fasciatus]|uniref:Zinc finger protein 276 n=1 Tax=Salarias fasciatus TaxID=181472 RepID=A0A672JE32_SALFA|nr:zinc finger protein 276 [Salarias fasciatus]XP_029952876.1 zinc finger protein 276 [Salarias fasciatus]